MLRYDCVGAAALCLALSLLAGSAPAVAARTVQGGVVLDGVPSIDADIAAALPRYAGAGEARLLDWLGDGSLLIGARTDFLEQLQRLRAVAGKADAAAASEALGAPDDTVVAAGAQGYRNESIFVLRDETGADDAPGAALYLQPLDGGDPRLLVSAAAHPGTPAWAHDGRRLAFSARLREGRNTDLYVLDTALGGVPRLLAAGTTASWQVLDWTSADRALLVRHPVAGTGDELLLVDVETGTLRRVDAPGERSPGYGRIGEARLAPDGRGIYCITDRDSDFAQLRRVDLYGAATQVLSLPVNHDVEHFDVSADGRYLAYSWNEGGYSRVTVIDRKAALESAPADLPAGVIAALKFDRGGTRLALEIAPSAAPRGVYVYEPASGVLQRWTRSELGALSAAQLVSPQTIRFPTWDRPAGTARMLAALLYRPRSPAPHPVLVLLGDAGAGATPQAQLDLFVQYCVNELGFSVIAPGLRTGEAGLLDLGALLAWVGAQRDLQREHVLLLGRGAGGSLALSGLGLYGDRLSAAVSIDGTATSAQLAPIRAPVLLVRGLLDPPLDAGAAEQLLWRLRSANVRSWFIAPRDSGGRLTGSADLDEVRRVIAQFLLSSLGAR
jgi:dipeptidyl aminopeptidase/acylaminoacyl peptidase